MLCVITRIRNDVFDISNVNNRNQVHTVINTLFADSTEKEFHETLDKFWSEYTNLNYKNDPFDSKNIIWSSKYICDGNSHMWHQK